MQLWLWSGSSLGTHVSLTTMWIVHQLTFFSTREPSSTVLKWVLKKIPYLQDLFFRNFSPSDPRHGNGPYNNDIPTDPIFTLNKTYDTFRGCFFCTELTLFAYGSRYYLSAYPFDMYVLHTVTVFRSDAINPGKFSYDTYISVFAQDLATNNSVAISLPASYGVIA